MNQPANQPVTQQANQPITSNEAPLQQEPEKEE